MHNKFFKAELNVWLTVGGCYQYIQYDINPRKVISDLFIVGLNRSDEMR